MNHPDDDPVSVEAQRRVDEVVAQGPGGAFAVAGVATFLVIAMVFVFYFVVYLPRGAVQ
ncbi:hypothetical protein [Massilia sp. DWR3-1-1]|uniref:hypothetical protein n=1 Tax=Massilia sp. DWR3-1-1 TaxID=2804559 RepID=UPI003CEDC8A1